MSDHIAPERIERIDRWAVQRLTTAADVVRIRDERLADEITRERDALDEHLIAVTRFGDRLRFGSSVPHHAEGVMDWLIAQGWTPPENTLILKEGENDE